MVSHPARNALFDASNASFLPRNSALDELIRALEMPFRGLISVRNDAFSHGLFRAL